MAEDDVFEYRVCRDEFPMLMDHPNAQVYCVERRFKVYGFPANDDLPLVGLVEAKEDIH
jgi:hypothetical protein